MEGREGVTGVAVTVSSRPCLLLSLLPLYICDFISIISYL